jgi:HAD superfamily hydrolase (TIGR01490 family)
LSIQQADTDINTSTPQHVNTSTLVLFDFDGTITTKDTLIEFVLFYRGRKQYLFGMFLLAPILALFVAKLIPNWKAKQHFLSHHFKGEKISTFNSRCLEFTRKILPGLIRPQALKAIEDYRKQNVTVAVVSASAENWVKPWCDANGLICLATKLEVKDGAITGQLSGRNCYGDEKVCRIKEHFNIADYQEVIAYGDSSGDKEMFELAHKTFYKPFRVG